MNVIRTTIDADHIVTIWLDQPEKAINTVTPQTLADLANCLAAIEKDGPRGVIIASAKGHSFEAGADLFAIRKMSHEQVTAFLAAGQALFERIARLPMPTVAAINGDCLGGGLELALACKARVAADDPSISIGLPEVKLGILPGWGGTVRLPRLIGLPKALPLILAGKTLPPKKALRAGIVDEVVRPEALLAAAKRLILHPPAAPRVRFAARAINYIGPVRRRVFAAARARTQSQTRGHYPAPMKIIDVIATGYDRGPAAGLEAERRGLSELMGTDACANLLRLFFLRQGAKREIAAAIPAKPHAVNYAAVIGGGTMGAGIVHGLVKAGIQVRLLEVDANAAAAGLGRVRHMLDDDVAAGRMTQLDARHALNRVAPTTEWTGLGLADFVIEAVVEKMDLKREVFAKLDRLTRSDAVLASNTSSLSITEMARSTSRPRRVVGLHFFNPVPKMPLVEIVRTADSDADALATAAALAGRMGKTPVLVGDAPGFLVNRVLIPYLAEALLVAAEGTPIPAIDEAMKDWGMPMGPFELLDEIGLDVSVHVLRSLNEQTGSKLTIPPGIERALERGWLGKKSGSGFYHYSNKKRAAEPELNQELSSALTGGAQAAFASGAEAIQWRLVLPMTNEAARVLEEGVTDSTDAIDLATVLGLGLAPFRGGLARFADSVGADQLVRRLTDLAARLGPRFEPAPLLRRFAEGHRMLAEFRELKRQEAEPAASNVTVDALNPKHA